MSVIAELRTQGISATDACEALEVPRSTFYRKRRPKPIRRERASRPTPARALSPLQRKAVLDVLHSERFVDRSPAQVYATLLDDDETYLCSARTMYRILDDAKEVRERRNQRRRPNYKKPELLATAPNQVWTWDLTKLRGPEKWTYYYLYMVLDLFSRMIVGWMLAHRESGDLACDLFTKTYDQQGVEPGQLIVHADRGSAPAAKTLAQLHADLGIERSFSRPHVSNDNPFSESGFKTMKYSPGYPDRFGSYPDALSWCQYFVPGYNNEHRHSSLEYLTPAAVHYGEGDARLAQRQKVLEGAYRRNPERFVRGEPVVAGLAKAVWINPPEDRSEVHLATARKVPLPGATASGDEVVAGSRIAEGDERSELVLDAVASSSHSGHQPDIDNRGSTLN